MPKLTDAIARVYERFGQPSQEMLPFSRVVDGTRACYELLATELRLSDVEWNLKFVDFQIPSYQELRFPIPAFDYGLTSRVERLYDGNVGFQSIEIVAIQNLHIYRGRGMQAVAIVGKGDRSEPTMEFALYERNLLRLWYEPDIELYPDVDATLEMRAAFVDFLGTMVCQRLLPFVNLPGVNMELLMDSLMKDEARWRRRWETWIHKQPGRGSNRIRAARVVQATSNRRGWRF